jgi:DNA excision repair protein ERCC-4
LTLAEITDRHGSSQALIDWLSARKLLVHVDLAEQRRRRERGDLVSRAMVEHHCVGAIDGLCRALLYDAAPNIVRQLHDRVLGGSAREELEQQVCDIMSAQLKLAVRRIRAGIRGAACPNGNVPRSDGTPAAVKHPAPFPVHEVAVHVEDTVRAALPAACREDVRAVADAVAPDSASSFAAVIDAAIEHCRATSPAEEQTDAAPDDRALDGASARMPRPRRMGICLVDPARTAPSEGRGSGGRAAGASGRRRSGTTMTDRPRILIDHRERRPWVFSDAVDVETVVLPTADYSLAGHSDAVAIERKSLDDLVLCVGPERERFLDSCRWMQAYPFRVLVVEAELCDVLAHRYESRTNPQSVVGTTVALGVDYGVWTLWARDAATAANLVERALVRYWKRQQSPEAHADQRRERAA